MSPQTGTTASCVSIQTLAVLFLPLQLLLSALQEMACLVSLTRLVLDNNMLRQLPDVVPKLPALAVLQASGNRITHLPDTLGQLQSLQALMVSENQVGLLSALACLCWLHQGLSMAAACIEFQSPVNIAATSNRVRVCHTHDVPCCCFALIAVAPAS